MATTDSTSTKRLKLRIWRQKSANAAGHFVEYSPNDLHDDMLRFSALNARPRGPSLM